MKRINVSYNVETLFLGRPTMIPSCCNDIRTEIKPPILAPKRCERMCELIASATQARHEVHARDVRGRACRAAVSVSVNVSVDMGDVSCGVSGGVSMCVRDSHHQ